MILAIDLGGTRLRYGIFDPIAGPAYPLEVLELPTEKDFLSQLKTLVLECCSRYRSINIAAIGVPGPTSRNVMEGSRPLNIAESVDFNEVFSQIDLPFVIRNDLYMAAHREVFEGAGQDQNNFCLVSLSTGIGVSVIYNGSILEGRIEAGHQIFLSNFTPQQSCTNHNNCWASLASGDGIEKRFGTTEYKSAKDIFSHVLTSHNLNELREINAIAFGNLINMYDPDVIIIMGSLGTEQFSSIIPSPNQIAKYSINRPIPPVKKSTLVGQTGVIGAFYVAQDACTRDSQL